MKKHKFALVLIIVLSLLFVTSCDFKVKQPVNHFIGNENAGLGVPDDISTTDPSNKEHYLIEREAYVLSYNNTKHIPNWVAWHLDKGDFGKFKRTEFMPDPDLPEDFDKITTAYYTGSGFDRGHMCPSHARSKKSYIRDQTYYMTNIIPQNPKNNQQAWNSLENEIQKLCENNGKEAYIIAGPYGVGGQTGDNGSGAIVGLDVDYIDKYGKKITVPAYTWKVAIVFNERNDDIDWLNSNDTLEGVQVYAVWMPNNQKVGSSYKPYTVTIDFIEEQTGFDFFAVLNDDIENQLEAM